MSFFAGGASLCFLQVQEFFLLIVLPLVFHVYAPISEFACFTLKALNFAFLLLYLLFVLFAYLKQVIEGGLVIFNLEQGIKGLLAFGGGFEKNSVEGSLWDAQGIAEE